MNHTQSTEPLAEPPAPSYYGKARGFYASSKGFPLGSGYGFVGSLKSSDVWAPVSEVICGLCLEGCRRIPSYGPILQLMTS